MSSVVNNMPELWGLAALIGEPVPGQDAAVIALLADPRATPPVREVLNAAFLIAGYIDSAAAAESGTPENGTLTAHALTLLAGPGSKELADTVMRFVDRGRIRITAEAGRALDLSYERLFSLTRAERAAQFHVPITLLSLPA